MTDALPENCTVGLTYLHHQKGILLLTWYKTGRKAVATPDWAARAVYKSGLQFMLPYGVIFEWWNILLIELFIVFHQPLGDNSGVNRLQIQWLVTETSLSQQWLDCLINLLNYITSGKPWASGYHKHVWKVIISCVFATGKNELS